MLAIGDAVGCAAGTRARASVRKGVRGPIRVRELTLPYFRHAASTRRSTRSSSATAWAPAQSASRRSTGKCSTQSAIERSGRCPAPRGSLCSSQTADAATRAHVNNSCQKAVTTRIYEKQKSRKRCAPTSGLELTAAAAVRRRCRTAVPYPLRGLCRFAHVRLFLLPCKPTRSSERSECSRQRQPRCTSREGGFFLGAQNLK